MVFRVFGSCILPLLPPLPPCRILEVWRHTCFSLDRSTGRFVIVEDGKLQWDKTTPEVVEWMKDLRPTQNIFTAGCVYRATGAKYMSMYGSITDVQVSFVAISQIFRRCLQVFGRGLSVEEMAGFTTCSQELRGDIISWEEAEWSLASPRNTTVVELLDLERDVCPRRNSSLLLVPQRMSFTEGLRLCRKLSGEMVSYTERRHFEELTHFMAKTANSFSDQCSSAKEAGAREVQVYLAGQDEDREGEWLALDGGGAIQFLPWAPNRPYNDGEQYNCLMLEMGLGPSDRPHLQVKRAEVNDEVCEVAFCPLCRVSSPVAKVQLRGLCTETIFNTEYIAMVTEEGRLRYLGQHTSFLQYDREESLWLLYDRKAQQSRAVSLSAENSLLLGLHTFDLAGVEGDKCTVGRKDKQVKVKLTSCGEGSFTCSDGECVSMNERCNQISNCKDKSDEEHCKMLIMEDNYNKKISPFGFDAATEDIIPVNVQMSMAVMDILDINEVDLNFVLKFRLLMEWYDHRLVYHNLKLERSENLLTREEIEKLWIPFVVFSNTYYNDATTGDDNTELTITREGEFVRSTPEVVEEINIFTGQENRLTFQQVFAKTFKCQYELQLYPFDTQVRLKEV